MSYNKAKFNSDTDTLDERDLTTLSRLESLGYDDDSDEITEIDFDKSLDELKLDMSNDNISPGSKVAKAEGLLTEESPTQDKVKRLLYDAFPVIGSFFLSTSGQFTLLAFAGHIQEKGLAMSPTTVFAGVSMANLYANVTYRSVIIGMSGAIDTLGSQNNGAKNYEEVGYVLQRSVFVLMCVAASFSLWAWLFADKFFLYLGMEADLCEVVGKYLKVRLLEMPFSCFNESYEKYLMAIGIMNGPMKANIALNISVVVWSAIFMGCGLEYMYLAVAWVLSVMLASVVFVAASYHEEAVQRTLMPINLKQIFDTEKLWEFFKLGVPGTVMLCSEWWAYEILTVFAGLLGSAQLACMAIILQTCALFYMIPLGLSVATASLVGNAMGAGMRDLAIQYSKLAIYSIVVIAVLSGVVIFFVSDYIFEFFTSDRTTLDVIDPVAYLIPIFFLFDCVQGVSAGVFRGAGQQAVAAVANVIAFYIVALPLAWVLCFNVKMGITGLMIGISMGCSLQSGIVTFLIFCRQETIFRELAPGVISTVEEEETDDIGGGYTSGAIDDEEQGGGGGVKSVLSKPSGGWFSGVTGSGQRDKKEALGLTLDYSQHDNSLNPIHYSDDDDDDDNYNEGDGEEKREAGGSSGNMGGNGAARKGGELEMMSHTVEAENKE
jgi:MATE family multidrug resistance protein